ncbi:MAG: co-chaperone YbbN [Rhodospirillaceae bacterium]|nr:co-chaperone YbbN [Rhodospirillaceae bacterium]
MEPITNDSSSGNRAPQSDQLVKDATEATFVADVIKASGETPVVVDFWSPRYSPCKQLTPLLEKFTAQAKGALQLVKVNVDENPALAQQLRIQSIPAVYVFSQGRPVDGFTGALPEDELKTFFDRLMQQTGKGDNGESLIKTLEQAKTALEGSDPTTAAELYSRILTAESNNTDAVAGLVRCYVATGDHERARNLLDSLEEKVASASIVAAARTALELAEQGVQSAGDLPRFQALSMQNPDDHQARFDLATAQFANGQQEAAVESLLEIIRHDKEWNDQAARLQLLKFFEALGHAHPLAVAGRRSLSTLLFV